MWWTHNKHSCMILFLSAVFNCTVHGHGKKFWTSEVKKIALGNWKVEVPNSIKVFKNKCSNFFPGSSELLQTFVSKFENAIFIEMLDLDSGKRTICFDYWACLPSVNNQLMFDISGNFTSPCKNYMFRKFKSWGALQWFKCLFRIFGWYSKVSLLNKGR